MIGETVTVLTRVEGADDRYNKPTFTWPTPGTSVPGVAVAPRESAEPLEAGRAAVIIGLELYMPAGTVIGAHDRVVVRGETHEVDGLPGDWRSPYTAWRPGIVVLTKRVEG